VLALIFKASGSALHAVFDQVGPNELDYPRIVVAIGEIVIESRETMLLTSLFHSGQLICFEFVTVDVSPVEC
jgi:hypothetical protein